MSEKRIIAATLVSIMGFSVFAYRLGYHRGKDGADLWYTSHPVYQQITGDNNTTDLDPACEQQ